MARMLITFATSAFIMMGSVEYSHRFIKWTKNKENGGKHETNYFE